MKRKRFSLWITVYIELSVLYNTRYAQEDHLISLKRTNLTWMTAI